MMWIAHFMTLSRRSFIRNSAVLGALPIVAGIPACDRPPDLSHKNLVVVLVDQLRKTAADDWLNNVNDIADQGIRFEQMRAVAPWTYPSVLSLLSGLYPQQHGANGDLFSKRLSIFDPRLPLLQKSLKILGYRTSAFVANPFLHLWNSFHEGFDHYDVGFISNQGAARSRNKYVTDRMFADTVNPAILNHFDRTLRDGIPEFTYVHFMDVHGPWFEGVPFEPDYESSVRYIDKRIIELYDYFMNRYQGDVLFFVMSDHGRAWGVDRLVGYGKASRVDKHSVHDFNLRIPFMILPGSFVPAARQIVEPYSNIDFVKSIHDWLDLRLDYPAQGESFMPATRGELTATAERKIYAKMSAFGYWNDAIVLGQKKYMRFFDIRSGEIVNRRVFDLKNDPHETKSMEVDRVAMDRLFDQPAGLHDFAFDNRYEELEPELIEQLRALGYLE
jgi:arylsulfatase A-like enzyme